MKDVNPSRPTIPLFKKAKRVMGVEVGNFCEIRTQPWMNSEEQSLRAYFCGYCLLYKKRQSRYVMGMIEWVMVSNNRILNLTHFWPDVSWCYLLFLFFQNIFSSIATSVFNDVVLVSVISVTQDNKYLTNILKWSLALGWRTNSLQKYL